jgi:outer membrane protein, multidrug efflux system
MRTVKAVVSLSLAFTLAGCSLGPKYSRPSVDAPGGFRGQAPELSSTTSLADEKWFEVFHDEQLQALIRTALQQNYDLRITAERVMEAQAQVGVARSGQLPSLGVGVEGQTQRQAVSPMGSSSRWDFALVGASAAWELDFWGKYRKATEAARADLVATEWGRKAVLSSLVSDVASSYFRLRALDLQLEITERTLKSRRESLRLTKLLYDSGSTSLMDLRQSEQLVYTASAAIPELQKQIAQQENALSVLLGKNPGPIVRGKDLTSQTYPASVPAGLPSQLIERRPDIRQAEQQMIAANARIGIAKAAYFPTISLTGTSGFQSSALTSLFHESSSLWTLNAAAVQPVFTGGKLRSNVRIAEAQQREAALNYQKTIQGAFRDVADALVAYQKSSEATGEQEKLVNAAQGAAHLAQIRYEGAATSYLEVLTNETNYYSAQLGLTQSRLNQLLALVQVYSALGGGWE